MEKRDILEQLISHYANGNKAKFATLLGVSPQSISTWLARNTFDVDKIYANCVGVSGDWLLTGYGSMLKGNLSLWHIIPQATKKEFHSFL